jgi:hypothetical protein
MWHDYAIPEVVRLMCPVTRREFDFPTNGTDYNTWLKGPKIACPFCNNTPQSRENFYVVFKEKSDDA